MQHPQAHFLVARLYQTLQDQPQTGPELLTALTQQKRRLCAQISDQELALQARWPMWKKAAATLALSVSQQPDYQLGQLSSQAMSRQLDQQSWSAALREPLPPELAHQLNHVVGFSFLGIALWVSNQVGYAYHALGAVNRAVFAHITPLLRLSRVLDTVMTRTALPVIESLEQKLGKTPQFFHVLKQGLRFDEIGFLEKEPTLQWLNGLGINVLMSGQPVLASGLAYSLATLTSHSAMGLVEQAAHWGEISPELTTVGKVAAHMALYSLAYREGLNWSHQWGLYPQTGLSQAEALSRLGLTAGVKEKEIQRRYRQLSKQFHPDKCPTPDCAQTMVGLNEAYAVLSKKMR